MELGQAAAALPSLLGGHEGHMKSRASGAQKAQVITSVASTGPSTELLVGGGGLRRGDAPREGGALLTIDPTL